MAGVIEHYSKFEVRAAEGLSESDIHGELVSVCGLNVSAERKCLCGATMYRWPNGNE
jgi:hypothetical protein